MTAIPAAGYFITATRTNNEARTAQDDILAVLREFPSGKTRSELTLDTLGACVPTGFAHTIDTFTDAATDNLDNITTTNTPDGRLLLINVENIARVVTVRDQQAGAGQIHTLDGADIALDTLDKGMLLERVSTDWYERVRLGVPIFQSGQTIYINETANADMTVGFTINQGANDDQIAAFKSSDVVSTFTTQAEVDTYTDFQKFHATDGGLNIRAFAIGGTAFQVEAHADATDIADTDTTADVGVVTIAAYEDVTTTRQNVTLGNIFAVTNGSLCRLLLKEDGELHVGNTTLVTLADDRNDIELLRAFDHEKAAMGAKGLIRSEWDDFVQYNKDDLVKAGIIGKEGEDGSQGLWNVTQHIQLLNGAIWQGHIRQKELEERLEKAEEQLKLIPKH